MCACVVCSDIRFCFFAALLLLLLLLSLTSVSTCLFTVLTLLSGVLGVEGAACGVDVDVDAGDKTGVFGVEDNGDDAAVCFVGVWSWHGRVRVRVTLPVVFFSRLAINCFTFGGVVDP